jgi:hypothetical protein
MFLPLARYSADRTYECSVAEGVGRVANARVVGTIQSLSMTMATGDHAEFSSDPAGDRRARLAVLIYFGLKTRDSGTADALAREVLRSLPELDPLDRANWRLKKTNEKNEKMRAALEHASNRDIIMLGSEYVTIAEALSIEARNAIALHPYPDGRHMDGYEDACREFISKMEARCQEIEASEYNLMRGADDESFPSQIFEFSSEYISLETEIAELPRGESSQMEHRVERVHKVLERYHRYIGIPVNVSVSRVLVESIVELSTLNSVLNRLADSEHVGHQLQAELAQQCGVDNPAEIAWREALANEMSRFTRITSLGPGIVGGDYAVGYSMAIKRISRTLQERAEGIRAVSFAD